MPLVVILSLLIVVGCLTPAAVQVTTTKPSTLTTRLGAVTTKPMTVSSTTSKSAAKLTSSSQQPSSSTSKSSAVTSQSTAPRSTASSSSGSIKCSSTRLDSCTFSTLSSFSGLFSQPWSSSNLNSACIVLGNAEACVKNIPGCADTAPETSSWRPIRNGYNYICGQGLSDFLNGSQLCFSQINEDNVAQSCIANRKGTTCVMAREDFSCIQTQISSMLNCSNASGQVYATYVWYTQLQPNLTSNDLSCNILVPPASASNSGSTNVVPVAVGVGVGVGVPVLIGIIVGIVLCVKLKCCPACCDHSNKAAVPEKKTKKSTKKKKVPTATLR